MQSAEILREQSQVGEEHILRSFVTLNLRNDTRHKREKVRSRGHTATSFKIAISRRSLRRVFVLFDDVPVILVIQKPSQDVIEYYIIIKQACFEQD